jgi:hypothetical protein
MITGRQTQMEHRKPTAACFNGPDYKRPAPTNSTCPCTMEADTECDYGYLKSGRWVVNCILTTRTSTPDGRFAIKAKHLRSSHIPRQLLLMPWHILTVITAWLSHLLMPAGNDCLKIPYDRMPFCPAINQNHYTVSSTGKRQVGV